MEIDLKYFFKITSYAHILAFCANLNNAKLLENVKPYLGESTPLPLAAMHRLYQECVEDGYDDQWHKDKESGPAPVEDSAVHIIQTQRCHPLADDTILYFDAPLKRCGAGEKETQDVDAEDEAAGPGLGAEHAASQRVAHGDVALERERRCQPYRYSHCNNNISLQNTTRGFVWEFS